MDAVHKLDLRQAINNCKRLALHVFMLKFMAEHSFNFHRTEIRLFLVKKEQVKLVTIVQQSELDQTHAKSQRYMKKAAQINDEVPDIIKQFIESCDRFDLSDSDERNDRDEIISALFTLRGFCEDLRVHMDCALRNDDIIDEIRSLVQV